MVPSFLTVTGMSGDIHRAAFHEKIVKLAELTPGSMRQSVPDFLQNILKAGCLLQGFGGGEIVQAPEGGCLVRTIYGETGRGNPVSRPLRMMGKEFGLLRFFAYREPESEDAAVVALLADQVAHAILDANSADLKKENERLSREMEERSRRDALTDLPGGPLFVEQLSASLSSQSEELFAGVLFIGLDRFRQINRTLGREQADVLLRHVGERLAEFVGEGGLVARMGGDEFAVALTGSTSEGELVLASRKLLADLRNPYAIAGFEVFLTASIGASLFPRDSEDARTLVKLAEQAMCRAKRNGKNDTEFFFGRQHSDDRLALEMEGALRTAVENNELEVLYQPVVRMDGRIDGMEALLVWNHPRMGKITPHRFIPIAEETGLIVPIGAWVIDQVCRQNARWQENGLPPVKVSVNVSTLQFGRADFVETVRKALADSALQARYLELELTESILLRDVEQSLRRMSRLRKLGVSMAIDDFGTGYSSLNYLWRLPLDTLKIDRSFLPDLALPGGSMAVVETILSLAHSIGLRVIAEGVETAEQLELLRAAGCDRVQGHLFGYALPIGQIEKMLAANEPLVPKEL